MNKNLFLSPFVRVNSWRKKRKKAKKQEIEIPYRFFRMVRTMAGYLFVILPVLYFLCAYIIPYLLSPKFLVDMRYVAMVFSDDEHFKRWLNLYGLLYAIYAVVFLFAFWIIRSYIWRAFFPSITFINYKKGKYVRQEHEGIVFWIEKPPDKSPWVRLLSKLSRKKIKVEYPFEERSVIYLKRSLFPIFSVEKKIVDGAVYRKGLYEIIAEGGIKRRFTMGDEEFGEVTGEIHKTKPWDPSFYHASLVDSMRKDSLITGYGIQMNADVMEEKERNRVFLINNTLFEEHRYEKEEPANASPTFPAVKSLISSYRDLGADPDVSPKERASVFYNIVNLIEELRERGYRFPELKDYVAPERQKMGKADISEMDRYVGSVEVYVDEKIEGYLEHDVEEEEEEDEWE